MSPALIICVEQDPVERVLVHHALAPSYRLRFERMQSAAETIERLRPALAVIDAGGSDLPGFALARTLHSRLGPHAPPIIFLTGLLSEADLQLGLDIGGVDFVAKPVSPSLLLARVQSQLALLNAAVADVGFHDAVFILGRAGHYYDTDADAHVFRMAAYARALAEAVGWPEDECALLELAAPMHDTGKIGIPDVILRKPSKLDADEWVIMRQHTVIGHDILSRSSEPVFQLAATVALRHHERWDGTGYPGGLKGERIPEAARIVTVVDVFDALTSKRPYKEAWPVEQALDTMRMGRGSLFGPQLLDRFLQILPEVLDIKQLWDIGESNPEANEATRNAMR